MMNKVTNSNMYSIASLLLCCTFILFNTPKSVAQKHYNDRMLEYWRWGIHMNQVLYAPAVAHKTEGVYDIDTKPMRGYNIGIYYSFKRDETISYYTGFDIDFLPYYLYYYEVPKVEFPNGTPVIGYDYYKKINDHPTVTLPIGFVFRKEFSKKKFNFFNYYIKGDLRLHILQPGNFEFTTIRGGVPYFYLTGATRDINIISPTINVAIGIEWMTRIAMFNIDINAQKGTVPYFKGTYSFFNLRQSPDTKGIYKVRADYIGVNIGITPKKWSKKP